MQFEWLWEMVGPKPTGAGSGEIMEMLENLESLSLLGGRLVLVREQHLHCPGPPSKPVGEGSAVIKGPR